MARGVEVSSWCRGLVSRFGVEVSRPGLSQPRAYTVLCLVRGSFVNFFFARRARELFVVKFFFGGVPVFVPVSPVPSVGEAFYYLIKEGARPRGIFDQKRDSAEGLERVVTHRNTSERPCE